MPFSFFRSLFGSQSRKAGLPTTPEGERLYVIGDIHGRLDLFEALIEAVEIDIASRPTKNARIILLGDLVDRGEDSAGVIHRAREWQRHRDVRILAGNHEEMFLQSFDDRSVLRHFLKHGGRETILSYGIRKKEYNNLSLDEMFAKLPDLVPEEDRQFIANFEELIVAGDYLFAHAGIDPTLPIEDQKRQDLLWIRERFLKYDGAFPKTVVHGHTIFDDVVDNGKRIGIDTGAFRTGRLTALVLENEERRLIQTAVDNGSISIEHKESTK